MWKWLVWEQKQKQRLCHIHYYNQSPHPLPLSTNCVLIFIMICFFFFCVFFFKAASVILMGWPEVVQKVSESICWTQKKQCLKMHYQWLHKTLTNFRDRSLNHGNSRDCIKKRIKSSPTSGRSVLAGRELSLRWETRSTGSLTNYTTGYSLRTQ